MVADGTAIRLNEELYPRSFLYRSSPTDVAPAEPTTHYKDAPHFPVSVILFWPPHLQRERSHCPRQGAEWRDHFGATLVVGDSDSSPRAHPFVASPALESSRAPFAPAAQIRRLQPRTPRIGRQFRAIVGLRAHDTPSATS